MSNMVAFYKAAKARWEAESQEKDAEIMRLTNALEARANIINDQYEEMEIERNRQIEVVQRTLGELRGELVASRGRIHDLEEVIKWHRSQKADDQADTQINQINQQPGNGVRKGHQQKSDHYSGDSGLDGNNGLGIKFNPEHNRKTHHDKDNHKKDISDIA